MRFLYICYSTIWLSLSVSSRDQEQKLIKRRIHPLSGEVTYVVEGDFFHVDIFVDGSWSNGYCRMYDFVLYFILGYDRILLTASY